MAMAFSRIALVLLPLAVACASAPPDEAESSEEALGGSQADHSCRVILRSVEPTSSGWTAKVDVAADLADAGVTVSAIVRRFGEGFTTATPWRTRTGARSGLVVAGFRRFTIAIEPADVGLRFPLGVSDKLEMIPFVQTGQGRLFDHNGVPDSSNYVIWATWAAGENTSVCPAVVPRRGTDSADRSCKVILRSVTPASGEARIENRMFVWDGVVDVSPALEAAGGQPEVSWVGKLGERRVVTSKRVHGGEGGLHRYTFHLVSDITAESPTAASTKIDLIPYVKMPSGDRIFDHNVTAHDYVLDWNANEWSIPTTGHVCR